MRTILKLKLKNKASKRIMKKILGFVILFGLGSMLFSSGQNNVYAQEEGPTVEEQQTQKIVNSNQLMNTVLKFVYALLWPVLFIAGIALDNTLVYGSFLHLDASLWSLRNIMKNFANFALGFMVLFAIVRSIFSVTSGKDDKWSPIKIIKKTIIAGVLIQMSRFIMAATIDVSTILTYSIGGLPMTVLENNPETKGQPIMGINASMHMGDENNSEMQLDYYGTYGEDKISLCDTKKIIGLTGMYIVGKKKIKVDDDIYFKTGFCMLGARPYKYVEYLPDDIETNVAYKNDKKTYLDALNTGDAALHVSECKFIALDMSDMPTNCVDSNYGSIRYNDAFFTESTSHTTLDSLLEKSKGFVGPFITIYSSLLDFSTIVEEPNNEDIISDFFELMIKVLFAVALFFPLVALAIVLLARIGILWLAIISSPIIVLLSVFKEDFGLSKMDGVLTYFDIKNIVSLIFAPVFVVFAISMSLIFLTALNPKDNDAKIDNNYLEQMGIEKQDDGYLVGGLINIDLDFMSDKFARMITNLFAVGIVWFFLFAAIKMTEIGKSVGGGMKEGVEKMMGSLPIIPIGSGVGINTVNEGLKHAETNISSSMVEGQNAELQRTMPWLFGKAPEKNIDSLSDLGSGLKSDILGRFAGGSTAAAVWGGLDSDAKASLEEKGITGAAGLSEIYNNYVSNNISEFSDSHETLLGNKENEDGIRTYDAENLNSDNIENMANSKGKWGDWAKGVLGGNVKTADGTFVMVNEGTHAFPEFKLVSQDDYAKKHLGQVNGSYSKEESDKTIRDRIEKQYIKQHGEMDKMSIESTNNMNAQIKQQQEEVSDRIVLLEKAKSSSETKQSQEPKIEEPEIKSQKTENN